MQGLLVALPQEACKLIPRPTTYVRYSPHNFRGAGLDSPAMRRDQETEFDFAVAERDTEIPAGNVPTLQNFFVTARLSHGIKDNTSNTTRTGECGRIPRWRLADRLKNQSIPALPTASSQRPRRSPGSFRY